MKKCRADAALLQGVFVSGQQRESGQMLFSALSSAGEEGKDSQTRAALHSLSGLTTVLLSGPCSQVSFCRGQREERGRADLLLLWDRGEKCLNFLNTGSEMFLCHYF